MAAHVIDEPRWISAGKFCACGECSCSHHASLGDGYGIPYEMGIVEAKGVLPLLNVENGTVDYVNWLDDDGEPHINVAHFVDPNDTELEQYLIEEHGEYSSECFASLLEDMCEAVEAADNDARYDPGALMDCDSCGNSISNAEPIILCTHGKFVQSLREPVGGAGGPLFAEDTRLHEHTICLACARLANDLRTPPIWGGALYNTRIAYR